MHGQKKSQMAGANIETRKFYLQERKGTESLNKENDQ